MNRQYPYRVVLLMYSGRRESHYIRATDRRDAFDKAHRFANPIAASGRDGVQFIDVTRLTKQYCTDNSVRFE